MKTVSFSFRSAASAERQQLVLGTVNSWPVVSHAALLKPDAKRETLRLMAYVSVTDEADADEVAKQLSDLPEVDPESVSVAPTRRLV